jgi:hypothetical protein
MSKPNASDYNGGLSWAMYKPDKGNLGDGARRWVYSRRAENLHKANARERNFLTIQKNLLTRDP